MQPLQICIGPIIRIGRESWCLPYAGFFNAKLHFLVIFFIVLSFLLCLLVILYIFVAKHFKAAILSTQTKSRLTWLGKTTFLLPVLEIPLEHLKEWIKGGREMARNTASKYRNTAWKYRNTASKYNLEWQPQNTEIHPRNTDQFLHFPLTWPRSCCQSRVSRWQQQKSDDAAPAKYLTDPV